MKSPKLDFGHIGKKLSNKKIDQYAREGRYGEEMQKRVGPAKQRKSKESTFTKAMRMLKEWVE